MKTESVENPQQPEDPAIEVELTPEQHETLKAWLKNKDFIEVVTGPGDTRATIINSRKLFRQNHADLASALGGELIDFRVQLISPFIDFIETYLTFFNEPGSLEAFITRAVYEKVWALHGDLTQFVKAKGHQLELKGWLEKFPERIHGPYPENEENDC
jgi:hypothetical protein